MDFLTSDAFVTIVSVVVSVTGLHLALRADIAKRIDRLGQRIDRLEQRTEARFQALEARFQALEERFRALEERFQALESRAQAHESRTQAHEGRTEARFQALEQRIDRLEERTRANHRELLGEIGELKTAVSVLSNKLDERSAPRPLVIREEAPGGYSVGDEAEGAPEPQGDDAANPGDGAKDRSHP